MEVREKYTGRVLSVETYVTRELAEDGESEAFVRLVCLLHRKGLLSIPDVSLVVTGYGGAEAIVEGVADA